MNDRHLTDIELAEALRAHLPSRAGYDLAGRVRAGMAGTRQQRAWASVFGALTDADPDVRVRALLIAAALLLAATIAGAAAAGALRLSQPDDPLETDLVPAAPGLLAYISEGDLNVANPDGTDAAVVAHGDGTSFRAPRWSADGHWIALQTPEPAILLFDMTTHEMRRVAAGTFGDWSPVGPELAFVTPDGDLCIFDVRSGDTRALVTKLVVDDPTEGGYPFWYGNHPIDWSPDDRWLLVNLDLPSPEGNSLARVDPRTGATTRLASTDQDDQYQASWAPDSRHIVYTPFFERHVSDRLTVFDTQAMTASEIVEPSDRVMDPWWSPDGVWIAYVARDAGLVLAHPDGSGRRLMGPDVDLEDAAGWLPDSSAFAYSHTDDKGVRQLHTVTLADGSDHVVVAADQPGDFAWAGAPRNPPGSIVPMTPPPPAASETPDLPVEAPPAGEPLKPDATWGRLVVRVPDGEADCGLGIITFPGGLIELPRPLAPLAPGTPLGSAGAGHTAGPQPAEMCDPAFAQDGSAVAQVGRSSTTIPWRDGAPASTTIAISALGHSPWSPQGGWLTGEACEPGPSAGSDRSCAGWVILRPDGTGRRDLPGRPSWSPDEHLVAVVADDGTLLLGNGDGTDLRSVGVFPAPVGWSPDGSTFAFVRDGNLWLAGTDGTDVRNLSHFDLGGVTGAWWSPDGRFIAILQGQTMWIVAPDGSVRQRVGTQLGPGDGSWGPAWAPGWSPDGAWLAIEHDDRVTLVHPDDWRVVRLERAWQPAWSLDGRHLAVVTDDGNGSYAADVTNPDGSGRITVQSGLAYPPVGWLR
jgi:Tol biopolymer transport system component